MVTIEDAIADIVEFKERRRRAGAKLAELDPNDDTKSTKWKRRRQRLELKRDIEHLDKLIEFIRDETGVEF